MNGVDMKVAMSNILINWWEMSYARISPVFEEVIEV